MAALLLKLSTLLYLVAASSYLAYLLAPRPRLAKAATWGLCTAILVHVVTIIDRWIELGVTPVTNFREALSFFALALAGIYLALQVRFDRPVLGAFVMPLAAVAMFSAVLLPDGGSQVPDSLRSTWLPIHISMAFLGDAAFAIAAAVASAYLIMERKMKQKTFGGVFGRLPSLESLDGLNYNLVRFGFVLLSMAILTGTLWAGQLWDSYFSWEPRQLSAMVAWMLYAGLIVSRWLAGWRGRRAAVITLLGFVVMVGSFVTLKVFDLGRHGGTYT